MVSDISPNLHFTGSSRNSDERAIVFCFSAFSFNTDVGKTYVTAGLAVTFQKMGIDVGVMKPFAAGIPQKMGFKSEDVEILSQSAKVNDPEILLNPQFLIKD